MNADQLRAAQAPLKEKYRTDPGSAKYTFAARGRLDPARLSVHIETGLGKEAGLHAMAGGDGTLACSGDMLLEALAACAGVTLQAVATSMGIAIRGGTVTVEGDSDFRGTLGIKAGSVKTAGANTAGANTAGEKTGSVNPAGADNAPVGCTAIRVHFDLDTDAVAEQLSTLIKLTERYCVIYQTLQHSPAMSLTHAP